MCNHVSLDHFRTDECFRNMLKLRQSHWLVYKCTNKYEPGHEKMCLIPYANNKGADQPCCSLPTQNDTSSLYIRNFKILAGLCSWAGQFVSCLVGDSRRHIFSCRGSYVVTYPKFFSGFNVGRLFLSFWFLDNYNCKNDSQNYNKQKLQ